MLLLLRLRAALFYWLRGKGQIAERVVSQKRRGNERGQCTVKLHFKLKQRLNGLLDWRPKDETLALSLTSKQKPLSAQRCK